MAETGSRFDVSPSVSNHFAWLRTQMASQRTLMAAVRTAVSLIGFGFTVAQFFQRLPAAAPGGSHLGPEAPRNLGLVLIAAGVVSLAAFTWQYHVGTQYLRSGELKTLAPPGEKSMRSSAYLTSVTVILIGVAAFGVVFVRL
jgi:putative membrane protein